MNYIKYLNNVDGCPPLFKNCIPPALLKEMVEISTSISELQIEHIKYNIENYYKYKDIENSKIWNNFLDFHNMYINKWLHIYDIKYLEECDKMLYINKF